MQDRYTGDIGDYVKYGLLRSLAGKQRLGIAWYLFPDEGHNADGRHVDYLRQPNKWRALDPELFDTLREIVRSNWRTVSAVQQSGILRSARFHGKRLETSQLTPNQRREWRKNWFTGVQTTLAGSEIVFADPDNGLCEDAKFDPARVKDWKRLPLSEAKALAEKRTAILYHHNTRRPGGHLEEIRHWMQLLGPDTLALRWRAYSSRTFFIIKPQDDTAKRLADFAEKWHHSAELISPVGTRSIVSPNVDSQVSSRTPKTVVKSTKLPPNKDERPLRRKPGWDARAIARIARERYGGYAAMFEAHSWPVTPGNKLMITAPSHIKDTYGSVAQFVAAHNKD